MNATWTDDELRRVGAATELQIATRRDDGSLRPYVTIWTIRASGRLYVRSAYGADNPWFRRATASGSGRIRATAASNATSPSPPSANSTQPRRRLSTPPTTPSTTATARRSSGPSPAHAAPVTLRLVLAGRQLTWR